MSSYRCNLGGLFPLFTCIIWHFDGLKRTSHFRPRLRVHQGRAVTHAGLHPRCFSSGVGTLNIMEPTTVGSLWLENDLHENELEFESHMGRSKKFVRVISHEIHGNSRDLNMYHTGRSVALPRGCKSMPPI